MKQKKEEKTGEGRKFAVIFENVFLFGLLRSVVRMLRTTERKRPIADVVNINSRSSSNSSGYTSANDV